MTQTALQRYSEIIRFHGLFRGLRRSWDQFWEVDLYDYVHGIDTRHIVTGEDYGDPRADIVHYQPTYTSQILRPLNWLEPMLGVHASFVDLGCGAGKALHVASRFGNFIDMVGVELHPGLASRAISNCDQAIVITGDALDVDLWKGNITDGADGGGPIVAFNKNSFSRENTARLVDQLRALKRETYFIYSNPVHAPAAIGMEPIWWTTGWHKNLCTGIYRL